MRHILLQKKDAQLLRSDSGEIVRDFAVIMNT